MKYLQTILIPDIEKNFKKSLEISSDISKEFSPIQILLENVEAFLFTGWEFFKKCQIKIFLLFFFPLIRLCEK